MHTTITYRQPTAHGTARRTPRRHPAAHASATRLRALKARVAMAFRAMAGGVSGRDAYVASVRFYRSSGHAWTRQLG